MADTGKNTNELAIFSYNWTIENMCSPCLFFSPAFYVRAVGITKWYLEIFCGNSGPIELKIWRARKTEGPDTVGIKLELSILGINGLPLSAKVCEKQFQNGDCFTFDEFANQGQVFVQRRSEFLPRDALTIRCRMWTTGKKFPNPDLCFARTVLRKDRGSFVWAIREFSTLRAGQRRNILLNPTAKEAFQLTLSFFMIDDDGEQYLCIKMLNSDEKIYRWCKVKIHLLDAKGEVVHSEYDFGYGKNCLKFEDFFERRKLMEDQPSLLPNDVLSMRCEFEMVAEVWSSIKNYRGLSPSEYEKTTSQLDMLIINEHNEASTITDAIKGLFDGGNLSDISLRAGSMSFPAHKCILSARSPVFKAMFSEDMKDKTSVEIPDVNEDILRELLTYIYTDTVGELKWQDAADLYRAANRYELLELKKKCSTMLKANVSVNNVCDILVLANMYQDQGLRETAQDFITQQDAEFFASDTWRCFKGDDSKMAMEIMERIVCNIKRCF